MQLNLEKFRMASEYITCKADLHEAMDRNGKMVPDIRYCTIDYLVKVQEGVFWCPNYADVKLRSCYRKPKKEDILNQLRDMCHQRQLELGIINHNKIDGEWLLRCISTLNPEHHWFKKDFYP